MTLKSIYLKNFRSYETYSTTFTPDVNLIWGDNGEGKTNLLEAIYLISMGRSFRTTHLSELIRTGASFFHIEAIFSQNGIDNQVKIYFDGKVKKLEIGTTSYSSFHPLLGNLPLVLHAPQDGLIIAGTPTLRRKLIDLHLAQSDPLYVHHYARYWRALKQRNCLLKAKSDEPMDCWEEEMAGSALYLLEKRKTLIEKLNPYLANHSKYLSNGKEEHQLQYHPSFSLDYKEEMKKNRKKEKEFGITTTGPHRDEFSFWINSNPAKLFASEGQKKTAIASLRLAEWDHLLLHFGAPPLLGIDDLGLPLDTTRQSRFCEKLLKLGQVFITSPISLPYIPSNQIYIST